MSEKFHLTYDAQLHGEKIPPSPTTLRRIIIPCLDPEFHGLVRAYIDPIDRRGYLDISTRAAVLALVIWERDPTLEGELARALELTHTVVKKCMDLPEDKLSSDIYSRITIQIDKELKRLPQFQNGNHPLRRTGNQREIFRQLVFQYKERYPKDTEKDTAVRLGGLLHERVTPQQVNYASRRIQNSDRPSPAQLRTLVGKYRKEGFSNKKVQRNIYNECGQKVPLRSVEAVARKLIQAGVIQPREPLRSNGVIFTRRGRRNPPIRDNFRAIVREVKNAYSKDQLNLADIARLLGITREYANKLYHEMRKVENVPPIRKGSTKK